MNFTQPFVDALKVVISRQKYFATIIAYVFIYKKKTTKILICILKSIRNSHFTFKELTK